MSATPQRQLPADQPPKRRPRRSPKRRHQPPSSSSAKPGRRPRRSQRLQRRLRGIALEMGILSSINLVVMAAAATAIVKLIPYNTAQREKLTVLQVQVESLDQRVNALRQDFNRAFDPQRSLVNRRELGNLTAPGQRPVHFTDQTSPSPNAFGPSSASPHQGSR
ncbi:MAG: hypothetical protein WBA10_09025 [Elainellaceae cyanobacterium]